MTIPRRYPPPVSRVIVVVADGLRPDIIPLLDLPVLGRLARRGASTLHAHTVRPSVTAAAMVSLLTGVTPDVHGLTTSRFRVPRPSGRLDPMPRLLRAAGVRTTAFMARLPWAYRRLGATLGRKLGFDSVSFRGANAREILAAGRHDLAVHRDGLLMMHWPDADRAGHDHGWPSPAYNRAARWIDQCLAEFEDVISSDAGTVLIVVADHGGGGRQRCDHDSDHPLDRTIPIILAGDSIHQTSLLPGSSLLDVPATILHLLGAEVPASYSGRVLHEALFAGDVLDTGWTNGNRRALRHSERALAVAS